MSGQREKPGACGLCGVVVRPGSRWCRPCWGKARAAQAAARADSGDWAQWRLCSGCRKPIYLEGRCYACATGRAGTIVPRHARARPGVAGA